MWSKPPLRMSSFQSEKLESQGLARCQGARSKRRCVLVAVTGRWHATKRWQYPRLFDDTANAFDASTSLVPAHTDSLSTARCVDTAKGVGERNGPQHRNNDKDTRAQLCDHPPGDDGVVGGEGRATSGPAGATPPGHRPSHQRATGPRAGHRRHTSRDTSGALGRDTSRDTRRDATGAKTWGHDEQDVRLRRKPWPPSINARSFAHTPCATRHKGTRLRSWGHP